MSIWPLSVSRLIGWTTTTVYPTGRPSAPATQTRLPSARQEDSTTSAWMVFQSG